MHYDTSQRILAFDPGGTTGWAWQPGQYPAISTGYLEGDHHNELLKMLHRFVPNVIVYERFDYRSKQRNAELQAVEYIGIIKLYSQITGCPLEEQQQLKDPKTFWDNKKLKVLGLYTTGIVHPNDAVRQLLHYKTQTLQDYSWVEAYQKELDK